MAGSLGRPTKEVLEQVGVKIVDSLSQHQTLPPCFSVALGELLESKELQIASELQPYRYLKIGLSRMGNRTDARTLIQNQVRTMDHGGRWILVYYAITKRRNHPVSILCWNGARKSAQSLYWSIPL